MSVELLAPAGSPEALDAAIGEGADAVYLGLKDFNARMRSANFTYGQFEAAVRSLRRMGKKLYVTVNTVFQQREADRMYQLLAFLAGAGPDALIVQDFGVAAMVRQCFPSLKMHASTQMNIASSLGANALSRQGLSRVVLARELSLEELRNIRADTNMELEVFVHGALCVSASGLCLFSSYLGGKSANRGLCTQACRRLYHLGETGGTAPASGYYFSPGDLQLVESLPDFAAAGINALKIEGRMKSAAYVGAVVSAYRLALDAIAHGDEAVIRRGIEKAQGILTGDFARAKTRFYFDAAGGANGSVTGGIDWLNPAQDGGTGISLGVIEKVRKADDERHGFIAAASAVIPAVGDTVRLHRSDDTRRLSHKLSFAGAPSAAEAAGYWISIPAGFGPGDSVYLIQTKTMSKRYEPVIPRGGRGSPRGGGAHGPGRERAPLPHIALPDNAAAKGAFPEGLYVAVSRTEDLYIVQSSRPVRVILAYTRKSTAYLLSDEKPPLPFKPAEIILAFDPYFPQHTAAAMAGETGRLIERGYCQFMLNNPGHLSLFRGRNGCEGTPKPLLIAGPWLYTFNAWALSFTAALGMDGFVSPLENNRQNLEKTLEAAGKGLQGQRGGADRHNRILRSMFFVPVFAWPPLFRIRADLGPLYDFDSFSDGRGESFALVSGPEGSVVIPEKPFSITDKIPFLKEAGFRRFIIDLCGPVLRKADYRDLMRAVADGVPLPHAGRFNWKDGFYTDEPSRPEGLGHTDTQRFGRARLRAH